MGESVAATRHERKDSTDLSTRGAEILKLDVPPNPADVGIFSAAAVLAEAENLTHAIVGQGSRPVEKQAQRPSALARAASHNQPRTDRPYSSLTAHTPLAG